VRLAGSDPPQVVDGGDGSLRIEVDSWQCVLAATVDVAAFVRCETPGGRGRRALELWDGFGEPVLGIDLPAAPAAPASAPAGPPSGAGTPARALPPDGGSWEALRARLAGTPSVLDVAVTRRGPAGSVPPAVLLRCFEAMVEWGEVIFDVPSGAGSMELFPNVPLRNIHLSERGTLLAGEPYPQDVHIHVNTGRTRALRFLELHRPGGRLLHLAKLLDGGGHSFLDAYFPRPHRYEEGQPVELLPERVRRYADLYERFAAEPGVEYARGAPLEAAPSED
jgi:hypothetical protein